MMLVRTFATAGLLAALAIAACEKPPDQPARADSQQAPGKGRILYYRNPMGLPDTSPVPKKDQMGMDYIPVYESEAGEGAVRVAPGKLQLLGVRTAPVEVRQSIVQAIRGAGTTQFDERRITTVTARTAGWVEKIRVAIGEPVERGQALFDFYSPDLIAAEGEYVAALESGNADLRAAASQRLIALGAGRGETARLEKTRRPERAIPISAPAAGIVAGQPAVQGARIEPQMPLYRIADPSSLWLLVEVQQLDLARIAPGQKIHGSFASFPGKRFDGEVEFIYPELTAETRTARVRIALPNPDGTLRAGLIASVEIESEAPGATVLAVPDSAVIDSGTGQVVLVEKGEGVFEPRRVRIGQGGDGLTEVLEGVAKGEKVVVGANFLIDSESNLRAALQAFSASAPEKGAAP